MQSWKIREMGLQHRSEMHKILLYYVHSLWEGPAHVGVEVCMQALASYNTTTATTILHICQTNKRNCHFDHFDNLYSHSRNHNGAALITHALSQLQ